MMVMILERVPAGVRGDLSKWLVEPHPGVFVGSVSAMVRDRLWKRVCDASQEGGIIQIWSSNNEQGFELRTFGNTLRHAVSFEGVTLITRSRKR